MEDEKVEEAEAMPEEKSLVEVEKASDWGSLIGEMVKSCLLYTSPSPRD